jgi:long-chain acyl-CoA synthetase
VSITLPNRECAGTVGQPLEGCEFRLSEDGEILSKGRHVFLGYFKNPEGTAETLKEGWFYTGDLGKWNDEGLLQIVGRKREIMKTSGGKMVAPVPIEEKLKVSNFISQVCMVGDNKKYFSALVTLSEAVIADLKTKPNAFEGGILKDPEMFAQVKAEFDRVNSTLASYEQIKKFAVIDREFSIADQEMTPTMKMKRSIIEKNFASLINSFYE